MKTTAKLLTIAALATGLGACQTTPTANADLNAARSAYETARANPYSSRASAAVDLERAQAALRRAEAAWSGRADKDEVRHLAYLAQRRAEAVQALADQAQAEERLKQAGAERDRALLEARTREADAAAQRARAAQANAQSAQTTALNAQSEAERQREDAEAARRQAAEQADRASALQRDLQALQARPTQRGLVVTMGDVLFATGSAQLQPGAQRRIDQLASVLQQYPERHVLVEGFTDNQGAEEANLALSQRRAEAFRQALLASGVAPERIELRAHGEAYPVASNATAAGRQQNRRVEVLFSDSQGRFAADPR